MPIYREIRGIMKHSTFTHLLILAVFCLVIFFARSPLLLSKAASVKKVTQNGLHQVDFKTSYGNIVVNLPEDMAAGETISGAVNFLPSGKNQEKKEKNLARLREYTLQIAGKDAAVETGWTTWGVPEKDLLSIALKNAKGDTAAQEDIPIFDQSTLQKTEEFQCPPYALAGGVIQVYGKFDGDFVNTLIWKGNSKLPLSAESPRRLLFKSPVQPLGIISFKYMEGDSSGDCRYHNIKLESSVGKTALKKGKTTELYVAVTGLMGLREKIPMAIENKTPDLVEIQGSNTVFILPGEIQAGGMYAYKTTLTSIKSGRIDVTAKILPPPVSK